MAISIILWKAKSVNSLCTISAIFPYSIVVCGRKSSSPMTAPNCNLEGIPFFNRLPREMRWEKMNTKTRNKEAENSINTSVLNFPCVTPSSPSMNRLIKIASQNIKISAANRIRINLFLLMVPPLLKGPTPLIPI
jgi:hypothetical protein